MSQLNSEPGKKEGEIPPSPTFCSFQVLNGLDDDHPHYRRQISLPSPLIQILISSRNTLTDTIGNNV